MLLWACGEFPLERLAVFKAVLDRLRLGLGYRVVGRPPNGHGVNPPLARLRLGFAWLPVELGGNHDLTGVSGNQEVALSMMPRIKNLKLLGAGSGNLVGCTCNSLSLSLLAYPSRTAGLAHLIRYLFRDAKLVL